MPFEARKTIFTVFSLDNELYNLIKSAFNMKLETTSTRTYKCQKPRRRTHQVSRSKTCIVVNEGLRAKRAYIEFLADFHFLQDFWQTDLF